MKKIICAALTLAAFVSAIYPPATFAAVKACDINAYVMDNDPKGLNVRETPDKNGRILGSLVKGEDEIMVEITATSGTGWLKFANAEGGASGDAIFKGTGWVFATMLGTGTKGYPNYDSPARLFATPSKKGKVLRQIPAEDEVTILDCSGSWAKVRYQGTTGWLAPENQCGSPFTTCN
jgi:uncharacterized protein YgiM (DUF1202 family)